MMMMMMLNWDDDIKHDNDVNDDDECDTGWYS